MINELNERLKSINSSSDLSNLLKEIIHNDFDLQYKDEHSYLGAESFRIKFLGTEDYDIFIDDVQSKKRFKVYHSHDENKSIKYSNMYKHFEVVKLNGYDTSRYNITE